MAVYVSGTLATLAGGPFATHDAQTGIDGWRTVADHATRDALGASPALRYRQGMAVYCLNTTGSDGVSGLWIANTAAPAGTDADWTQFAGGGLSAIANLDVLANISGGSAVPTATTLTSLIDAAIGTTQGDILYRGSATWSVLAPGTTGQLLASQGASANPHWVTASGSGTVTSVSWTGDGTIFTASADTPVTTSGTLTPASLIAQTAHYVLAGPTSAGPTAPTFRALGTADLPTIPTTGGGTALTTIGTASQVLGVNTGGTGLEYKTIAAGANVTITPTANTITIASSGGAGGYVTVDNAGTPLTQRATINFTGAGVTAADNSGSTRTDITIPATVTSVTFTGDGVVTSSTPSGAVTTSGTVTATLLTQTAHYVLAGPASAGPTAPTFRALAAADLPTSGLTINEWVSTPIAATVTGSAPATATTLTCTSANVFTVALVASSVTTITIASLAVGQTVKISTFQPGTGTPGTIAWTGQTIRWSGGTAGQATATASIGDTFILHSPSSGIISGSVGCPNF